MFLEGKGPVFQTMRRTARRLDKAGIYYAVLGGMALNAHKYKRATGDVDFLLSEQGLVAFREQFVGKDYDAVPGRARRFIDRRNGVTIDILVAGRFPGSGKPGPVVFPDPQNVGEVIGEFRYVDLATLVQLKLAARRWRDFADVVELIRFNDLDESFTNKLHPSIRQDFIECLEEKRRDDAYDALDD